jgi:hypothetical protein
MSDLPEFLVTQYDEEEALARATTPVPVPGRWIATHHVNAPSTDGVALVQGLHPRDVGSPDPDSRFVTGSPMIATAAPWEKHGSANMRHIAYHDPARVLADVAAKRERLRIWQRSVADTEAARMTSTQSEEAARRYERARGFRDAAERAVLLDARGYADRAGYKPTWTEPYTGPEPLPTYTAELGS